VAKKKRATKKKAARAKKRKRSVLGAGGDIYGLKDPDAKFFSSGCALLDCVLGGGWAHNRIANITGDKSTGKSLLAIEAAANFHRAVPNGKVVYVDSEAAFDPVYAEGMGLPADAVELPELFTVEDVFEDIDNRLDSTKPILYVIDSLDALSDRAEQKRAFDEGTYGTKTKQISTWFRRQNSRMNKSRITLMVVSQVRDAIGVTFGERLKRAGGHALDHYAAHALWLAQIGKINPQRENVKRVRGIHIRAKCKKNKLGPAFRECDFPLIFGYGVEDVWAGLQWLIENERTDSIGITESQAKKLMDAVSKDKLDDDAYREEKENIAAAVKEVWAEIEERFKPRRVKYSD